MNKRLLLFLPSLALGACSSPVNEHPSSRLSSRSSSESSSEVTPKSYNVLFIGNSFTHYNDLEVVSQNIATNLGIDFTAERIAISAHHLYEYANPEDEGAKLIAAKIAGKSYTHIILQEHSTYPVSNYNLFLEGARSLVQTFRENQPGADIRLYQTWAFQNMVGKYGDSIAACEEALCRAYQNAATTLGVEVHYVGKAFTKWLESGNSTSPYYSGDNKHPSYLGTYLSALIHVKSITGTSLSPLTYQGEKGKFNAYGETYVSDEDKTKLIQTAEFIYDTYGIKS